MRTCVLSCIAALIALLAMPASAPAKAEEAHSCHIGKPSYCFKYGGHLCRMWNNALDKPAACAKWTSACLDCHSDIPTCLGNQRPLSSAPSCSRCNSVWLACMAKIDQRFWPNRQTRKPE